MVHTPANKVKKLGAFGGVFTPSILTILGVILFLRLGFVVGHAGLLETLAIIVLANAISFFTSYSLTAIVTNMHIKGGGPYYIISRTLGPGWGGVIGVILFVAVSTSIGFYTIGAAEVIVPLTGWDHPDAPQWIAAGIAALLFGIAWVGADFSTKFQYGVMAILALALLSFFAGVVTLLDTDTLKASLMPLEESPGFWYLFAVFFPAITGFTQGVNMSGELREPKSSIVKGTLWAVGLSFGVYLLVGVAFAAALSQQTLATDLHAFQHAAWSAELVIAGIIAAAVSSALASFLGAPRVLQAMAKDRLLPMLTPFAKGSGADENPRRALIFAAGIVAMTIGVGEFNLIASIVTVFFLISFGVLNYATFYEAYAESPSFRPTFKRYNKWISFAGVVFSMGAIVAIDPVAGVVAFFLISLLFQYLRSHNRHGGDWADGTRSFNTKRVRDLLVDITAKEPHPRDWRPHILALLSEDRKEWDGFLFFASSLTGKAGTVSAVRIDLEHHTPATRKETETEIRNAITGSGTDAFPLVVNNTTFKETLSVLLQSYGIGPVKANTIIFGWPKHADDTTRRHYTERVITALRENVNLIVLKTEDDSWRDLALGRTHPGRIDLWWGESKTSHLMLLLAFLTSRAKGWEGSRIRILAQGHKAHDATTRMDLEKVLEESRIDAEITLVPDVDTKAIAKHSADAALVFMPMKFFGTTPTAYAGNYLDDPLFSIINLALVIAGEDIELDADPDKGG